MRDALFESPEIEIFIYKFFVKFHERIVTRCVPAFYKIDNVMQTFLDL